MTIHKSCIRKQLGIMGGFHYDCRLTSSWLRDSIIRIPGGPSWKVRPMENFIQKIHRVKYLHKENWTSGQSDISFLAKSSGLRRFFCFDVVSHKCLLRRDLRVRWYETEVVPQSLLSHTISKRDNAPKFWKTRRFGFQFTKTNIFTKAADTYRRKKWEPWYRVLLWKVGQY